MIRASYCKLLGVTAVSGISTNVAVPFRSIVVQSCGCVVVLVRRQAHLLTLKAHIFMYLGLGLAPASVTPPDSEKEGI